MVIRNYHWLNSASRVLILTCSAPLVQTKDRKQFSLFDLDLWPTTLTYNPRLDKVKIDPHAKNQGQRSNDSSRRAPTDKRTDTHTHTHGRYQTYYLPCYAVDNNWFRSQDQNFRLGFDLVDQNFVLCLCLVSYTVDHTDWHTDRQTDRRGIEHLATCLTSQTNRPTFSQFASPDATKLNVLVGGVNGLLVAKDICAGCESHLRPSLL